MITIFVFASWPFKLVLRELESKQLHPYIVCAAKGRTPMVLFFPIIVVIFFAFHSVSYPNRISTFLRSQHIYLNHSTKFVFKQNIFSKIKANVNWLVAVEEGTQKRSEGNFIPFFCTNNIGTCCTCDFYVNSL